VNYDLVFTRRPFAVQDDVIISGAVCRPEADDGARRQITILRAAVSACPCSSNALTTTLAP
jgi:hypothetical protein